LTATSTGEDILRGIQRSTVSRTQRKEGERLDVVLERLRQTGETVATPGSVSAEDFASILGAGGVGQRAPQHNNSLEADVVDFTIPRINEPGIFSASRSIALLQHFLDDLLPTLEESDELRVLATRLINDEISRQRDVMERMQAGIVA
jgi:hypothetical protein